MVRSFEKEIFPPGYKDAGLGFCGESYTYKHLEEFGLDVSRGSSNSGAYPQFNCYWLTVKMGHAEFRISVYEKSKFFERVEKVLLNKSLPEDKRAYKLIDMVVKETMKTTDIMDMLQAVYDDGVKSGRELQQEDIKKALGIKERYF